MKKAEHAAKKTMRQKAHLFFILILALCLSGLALHWVSGRMDERFQKQLADTMSVSPTAAPLPTASPLPEITPVPYESPIDFAALQNENPDAYAWVRINGTEVDTPVMQHAEEADFYLNHTFDKKEGMPGSVYSRNDTPKDFSAECSILYGHNTTSDVMFSTLRRYRNPEFFSDMANRTIQIFTPERELDYTIFAAVEYSNVLLTYQFDFSQEDGRAAFLDSLKESQGIYDQELDVDASDQLIVLSTCAPISHGDRRFLVVGALQHEET